MITEEEISKKVDEFLVNCDLKKTTNNIVIKKLESDFGVDLSHQKPLFRFLVSRFLQSHYHDDDDDDDDDDGDNGVVVVVATLNDENDDVSYDGHNNNNNHNNGFYDNDVQRNNISNGDFVNELERPARQNKEKNKRICFSGKYSTLSPELQKFLGVPHMTRTEVVKHLWTYVKENRLQDPSDGKNIICNETLRGLFGVDSINILQINKALTKHIWPPAKRRKKDKLQKQEKEEEVSVKSVPKDKSQKQEREEDHCGHGSKEKQHKKNVSGFLAPLPLSDTLIRFIGTGETALTRSDVIKRVWDYIKDNKLQDPLDRKMVICDEKLKELVNVDTFTGFTVSKLLTPHFVKL